MNAPAAVYGWLALGCLVLGVWIVPLFPQFFITAIILYAVSLVKRWRNSVKQELRPAAERRHRAEKGKHHA